MARRRVVAAALVVGAIGILAPIAWRQIKVLGVGVHQRAITRELADWAVEYRQVRNEREVDRAIDMLEYVQRYYVPGRGYCSDARTEAALEDQRAETVEAVVAGLQEFTGQDFGADVARWRAWRETTRQSREGKKKERKDRPPTR
jgi:hypothetical protein